MKHYVLVFVFNQDFTHVLLVRKERPDWMKGRWNGIGGKIEEGETPWDAAKRETLEEIGCDSNQYAFYHTSTFTCPGGTIFVYKAVSRDDHIHWRQTEDELLRVFNTWNLPEERMSNLDWLIPICWSDLQMPVLLTEVGLGL